MQSSAALCLLALVGVKAQTFGGSVHAIAVVSLSADRAILKYSDWSPSKTATYRTITPSSGALGPPLDAPVPGTKQSLSEPSSALARLSSDAAVACELVTTTGIASLCSGSTCQAIYCHHLRVQGDGSIVASTPRLLESGAYPTFPESAQLASLGSDSALACWHVENWQRSGNTDTRRDLFRCRTIAVAGDELSYGASTYDSNLGIDDLSLASHGAGKALACYSENGRNKCILMGASGHPAPNSFTFGDRAGTYTASPCAASRHAADTAVVCCERPGWLPWQQETACKSASVGSDGLGDGPWAEWTAGSVEPMGTVHLTDDWTGTDSNDSRGRALACYASSQQEMTCQPLNVHTNSWWQFWRWFSSDHLGEDGASTTLRGMENTVGPQGFAVDGSQDGVVACYRAAGGAGRCTRVI